MTWWLKPGWTAARCHCGTNIWQSGGDPDWGECFEHFSDRVSARVPEPEPEYPCGICNSGIAVTGVNGYGVCSADCAERASKGGQS